ncbi:hypothetical protein Lser_V15G04934 [Lactuca serriola]
MANSSFDQSVANHKLSYDVFISFGDDNIIQNFVNHLFSDFKRKGIHAFNEDNHLLKGEDRSPQIYTAIEQSRFLLVIFSKSFTSSPSCLKELIKILECKNTNPEKHQIRIIFHNFKLNGIEPEVFEWKEALTMAAKLPGWDLEDLVNGYESKFIEMISNHIFNELNNGPLHVGENLIGLHSRVDRMNLLEFTESNDVHMIGIYGSEGIGKTSIAKSIYNRLYLHFESSSFCEDVDKFVKQNGMIPLQRQVIEDITKEEMKIRSVGEGSSVMKRVMGSKRVLLVLDGVDHLDPLECLAGSRCWFGAGSLIVVTGKDRQLLVAHGVEKIYDVEVLDYDEGMELFCLYAFKQKDPKEEFKWLCERVVRYVKGHPLALKVLGCFLFGKTVREWENELDRFRMYPIYDIQVLISRFSSKKK